MGLHDHAGRLPLNWLASRASRGFLCLLGKEIPARWESCRPRGPGSRASGLPWGGGPVSPSARRAFEPGPQKNRHRARGAPAISIARPACWHLQASGAPRAAAWLRGVRLEHPCPCKYAVTCVRPWALFRGRDAKIRVTKVTLRTGQGGAAGDRPLPWKVDSGVLGGSTWQSSCPGESWLVANSPCKKDPRCPQSRDETILWN